MRRDVSNINGGLNLALSAWVLVACAGIAMAEPKDGAPSPGDKQGEVLGGPKVKDDAKPGEMGKLAGKDRRAEIPHNLVLRVLKDMGSEKAPAELRLNEEQVKQIQALETEYKTALEEYRKQHHDEVMQLREVLPPQERRRVDGMMGRPGPDGRPEGRGPKGEGKPEGEERPAPPADEMAPGDDAMKEPASREAVEKAKGRLKEIADGAPKVQPVHEKMYGVLTDAQREHAKKEVEKAREEMQKRAAERAKQRGAGEGERGERMPPAAREKFENLSPEEREKFKQMSPEEKREFIRKLMGEEAK